MRLFALSRGNINDGTCKQFQAECNLDSGEFADFRAESASVELRIVKPSVSAPDSEPGNLRILNIMYDEFIESRQEVFDVDVLSLKCRWANGVFRTSCEEPLLRISIRRSRMHHGSEKNLSAYLLVHPVRSCIDVLIDQEFRTKYLPVASSPLFLTEAQLSAASSNHLDMGTISDDSLMEILQATA